MWPEPMRTYTSSFILPIQPFGHNTATSQTGQTDRQTDGLIAGRTVLQTVAQKSSIECHSFPMSTVFAALVIAGSSTPTNGIM